MGSIEPLVPAERIERAMLLVRGAKVILDEDLASLYDVETGTLARAMKRNGDRFPPDFAFQLTDQEFLGVRERREGSRRGGRRYAPYAFTEQGGGWMSSSRSTIDSAASCSTRSGNS